MLIEVQTLMFIILIRLRKREQFSTKGQKIFYFIIQSGARIIFLLANLNMSLIYSGVSDLLITTAILTKLGLFPMHTWVYEIINFMEPKIAAILITFQKYPLIVLANELISEAMIVMILVRTIAGSLLMYFRKNLNQIIISSSIYSTVWILILARERLIILIIFYSSYFFISWFLMERTERRKELPMISGILFFLGLPPINMFFLKVFSIEIIVKRINKEAVYLIFISTMISIISYIKIFTKITITADFYFSKMTKVRDMKKFVTWGLISYFFILAS